MAVLQTIDLKKYYGEGENQIKALDGICLEIEEGKFTAIVGTSGSGKSTLLHMLGGLDTPTYGRVIVGGKDISKMKPDELTIFRRRRIGFVFQNYNLVPILNAKIPVAQFTAEGGYMKVVSKEDAGSTFFIYLPNEQEELSQN